MNDREIPRRAALLAGIAALANPTVLNARSPAIRAVRSFRLAELAGLRRFHYPIHAIVPDAAEGRNFLLARDGRPLPAQFRIVEGQGGRPEVALDFVASLGPLEAARYEVQFGRDVVPPAEPSGGLAVELRDSRYRVNQEGSLTFEVADDLSGFLRSVGSPRLGYLGEGSSGLALRQPGPPPSRPDSPVEGRTTARTRVAREGPFAVGLRSDWFGPGEVRSRLDLTVPRSKSWVQVAWSVDDPESRVAGLGLDLNLRLEGPEVLVDFGAGSTIYGRLDEAGQSAELVAGRARGEAGPDPGSGSGLGSGSGSGSGWAVRLGAGEVPPVLAASTAGSSRWAEGWAHVMDPRRCTALAVDGFGRSGARDSIRIGRDGRMSLARDYAIGDSTPVRGPKSLAFWLHFVPMPVQVGAQTSPQSILAPPRVEWDRPPA